ncbi:MULTISPECIES: ABC transporter permease [unclassified Nocardia]|uniref:ABC transporter permease n=1 Tax=unclassified Nocardia TaxID=2637762 RepID=UPI001CE41717|nr:MULTISPECIES: ABC transporter permease [unclassified Nocardia]
MHATAPITPITAPTRPSARIDNRSAYIGFALAYLFGHGAAALAKGADPLLALPGWLPTALLAIGLAVGTVQTMVAAGRAQRGASKPEQLGANLLGLTWIVGFAALFVMITGLSAAVDAPALPGMLWPTGATLVVGLIYLAEGAARRNMLHYGLGSCLALIAGASIFFGTPGLYWVLAIAGGTAYGIAAVLEGRRLGR